MVPRAKPIGFLLFALAISSLGWVAGCSRGPVVSQPAVPAQESQQAPSNYAGTKQVELCPITGLACESPGVPVAVCVDNHPRATPQAGIAQAELVYEAVTEGGITRLLAIYHCSDVPKIGPVRSTRPYFAYMAKEWDAILAHCGGLEKDVEPIQKLKVLDANELLNPEGFWRVASRPSPHNLYTSVKSLRKRLGLESAPGELKARWQFTPWSNKPAGGLKVEYSSKYVVDWVLDSASKSYRRMVNGAESVDENGALVTATNVIVQTVPTRVAYPDGGVEMKLIGEGKAWFLLGGRAHTGSWKKSSPTDPTLFFDDSGKQVALSPGRTWVQVVPTDAKIQFKDLLTK
ncbi:MAG: DUF3048 domain-containing protein [Bacillota bacterium]